jgi:small subunit ribosomal protein S2
MITLQHKDLLDAGVHFGHLTSKWHPNMAPFIFMERNGIHIIDLNKTLLKLQEATHAIKAIASAGKRILFVATKKQAKGVVEQEAKRLNMPYITERWLGGTLTNFATIRKLLKKMSSFDKLMKDTAYQNMAKKEQLMIAREKGKLERLLQGIADTTRLPAALFIVDTKKEHIAVKEAQKLGIPVFAITDTNTNPEWVDYPIPSNDDASRSIELIIKAIGSAIEEGLEERQRNKKEDTFEQKTTTNRVSRERNVEKVTSSEITERKARIVNNIVKSAVKATKKVESQQVGEVKKVLSIKKVQLNNEATTAAPLEKPPTTKSKQAITTVVATQEEANQT